jgi:hypothetical protein
MTVTDEQATNHGDDMTKDDGIPDAERAAQHYDVADDIFVGLWDENFHHGYWDSDEDQSSNREACDKLTDLVIERSGDVSGARLLDIGCGIGLEHEYREVVARSGLKLAELEDLSVQTHRTGLRVLDAVNEHHDLLVERYTEGILPTLEMVRAPAGRLPVVGYLLAVARKAE